jgi:hypothetical protein
VRHPLLTSSLQQFGQHHDDGNDGARAAQWTRNPGRNGICAVISEPLPDDESPANSSPTNFPPPVNVVVSPAPHIISPPPATTQFFNPNGNISPPASAANPAAAPFIPSSYSSLTGWAGEFGDHVSGLAPSSSSSGWFATGWQGPQRLSSSWGQQSDIPDSVLISRPNTTHQSSHQQLNHKITPYLDHLRIHPHPSSAPSTTTTPTDSVLHQLDSNITPTQSP